MPNKHALFPLLSLLTLAAPSPSDPGSNPILSCADVLCPLTNDGTTSASCTLLSTTYSAVGVAAIPSRPDLAWVQAITVHDWRELDGDNNPNPNPDNPMRRTFIKDFFMASKPTTESDGGGGGVCALFFTDVGEEADWEPVPSDTVSQGTCAEAMSEECVESLVERAKGVDVSGLGVEEACEKVKGEFAGGGGGGVCGRFTGEGGWKGVVGNVIAGEGAPEPITAAENASSNCWPVQPKERDLTLVAKFNSTGGFMASELIDKLFRMTPILTVFFPTGNGGSEVRSEAQLTCFKAIDETTATEEMKSDGTPNMARGLKPREAMGVLVALGVVGVLNIFC